jgi:hypothetical protein
MDELTMLVEVAGGEPEAVERLRAAGLRRAKEIAAADAEDLGRKSGLSAAAAKRLIKAAQEIVEPADERRARAGRSGLAAVSAVEQRWAPDEPAPKAEAARSTRSTDERVSRAESAALVSEGSPEDLDSRSFWRFG